MPQSTFGWKRSIGSGEGLALPDTKPSPEPMLTQMNCTMSLYHNGLIAGLRIKLEVSVRKELTDEISELSKAVTAINVVALTTNESWPPLTLWWLNFTPRHKHSACFIYGINTSISRTYTRVFFRLFSMCFVFYVHCSLCCNVMRTCEVNMKNYFIRYMAMRQWQLWQKLIS